MATRSKSRSAKQLSAMFSEAPAGRSTANVRQVHSSLETARLLRALSYGALRFRRDRRASTPHSPALLTWQPHRRASITGGLQDGARGLAKVYAQHLERGPPEDLLPG
eukprot:scaffold845_cov364-Prasinococcus_capsulatus_cf.AAC.20